MPRETLDIGPTPPLEDCAQVGSDGYHEKARKECRAFINQLKRQFPNLPPGVTLTTKSNPHDFGSYLDVVVYFNPNDETEANAAYEIDKNLPANWDDAARAELGLI